MVDNPKNNPVDDDVGFGNFEDEWSSSGDVDAFGSDDDAFGQEFGSDADPFSSDDGDVLGTGGFDGFEEDDSFHSIPTPDALSAEMEGEADPEDDFGDVGSSFDMDAEDTYGHDDVSDGGFGTDDFNSEEGDAFGDDGAQTTDQVEDVYGDNSYEESAFEEEGDAFSDEEEVAAPPATGSKSKGNLILAGGLVASSRGRLSWVFLSCPYVLWCSISGGTTCR